MKNTNVKYRLNSWLVTAVVVAAVILLNVIVTNLTSKIPMKIDLTSSKQYKMSQETTDAMAKLNKEVKVSVLGSEDGISPVTKEYLDKYKNMNSKFVVEYIDVYKNQGVLYTYKAKGENLTAGDILLECEGRYKIVPGSQLYSESFSADPNEAKYSFELETKLTNAVVTVSGMVSESVIYFLEGHGEQDSATFSSLISTQGYKNSKASITNQEIPTDAKLLISVTPSGDFAQDECEKIDKFLENGGNFMMIYTPGMPKLDRIDKYLGEWGIVPHQDSVVENQQDMVGQSPVMMFPNMADHEITKNLLSMKLPLMFLGSSSFDVIENNTQNAETKALITTSPKAVGKVNMQATTTDFEEGDFKGPLNLAVVAEKTYPTTSRVMVVGSYSAFELPEKLTGTKANSEFTANAVSFMTNNQTNLKIPPKIITEGKVKQLTNTQSTAMYYILVWLIPLLILGAGVVIWLRRRYL